MGTRVSLWVRPGEGSTALSAGGACTGVPGGGARRLSVSLPPALCQPLAPAPFPSESPTPLSLWSGHSFRLRAKQNVIPPIVTRGSGHTALGGAHHFSAVLRSRNLPT